MSPYSQTAPAPDAETAAAVQRAKALKAAEEEAYQDKLAKLRADAQAKADAKNAADAADAQAKAKAQQERVEAGLRGDYARSWQGSAADFDLWWERTGRIEALAADAQKRRAMADQQLVAAAASW